MSYVEINEYKIEVYYNLTKSTSHEWNPIILGLRTENKIGSVIKKSHKKLSKREMS